MVTCNLYDFANDCINTIPHYSPTAVCLIRARQSYRKGEPDRQALAWPEALVNREFSQSTTAA